MNSQQSLASNIFFSANGIAHAAFVPTGMITVLLGPMLPVLASRWSLNDAQSGYLVTAQFLGALLSTASSSVLLPRLGFRWSIATGQFLMALGVATLTSGGFARGLAAVFCYGMGIGLTVPTGNLMVAEASLGRRSSALNLLNFSWSAGAVACPFLLKDFRQGLGIRFFLYGIAGFLAVLTVVLFLFPGRMPEESPGHPPPKVKSWLRHLKHPAAIVLGSLFFLYVGTESALGTWLATYAKRASESYGVAWITVPSYFYGAILLGRVIAPISLRHVSDSKQACLGVVLAFISSGALIMLRSVPEIAIFASFAGLGLSTLYPIAISFLSSSFGAEASRVGGVMFTLSTLGGASIPWLVGFISTEFGSLKTALFVPIILLLMMFLLFLSSRLQRYSHRRSSGI